MKMKNEIKKIVFNNIKNVDDYFEKSRLEYLQCISSKKNYFNFLENINNFDFYFNVKLHQAYTENDFNNYDKSKIKIQSQLDTFTGPKIYCSFHFGSYKIINNILHEKNIDYSVVANKIIIDTSRDKFSKIHNDAKIKYNINNFFELIDANSNSGIIKMIRTLKEGKSLLIYIDGGNGLQGLDYDNEKIAQINFLGNDIYSRTGIAFLSNYLQIPIVPVISYRMKKKIKVNFYDKIDPVKEISLDNITQKIWDIFSKIIIKDPFQWEANLYANHFISNTKNEVIKVVIDKAKNYYFNSIDFHFFYKDENCYIYSINNSNTYKLSNNVSKLLLKLKDSEKSYFYNEYLELMHEDILNDFIIKKILI